jgi:hypothetical protein
MIACSQYKKYDCVCENTQHVTIISARTAGISLDEEKYRRSPIGRYTMYSICPQCS